MDWSQLNTASMPNLGCIQARMEKHLWDPVYSCIPLAGDWMFQLWHHKSLYEGGGRKTGKRKLWKERVKRGLWPEFVTEASLWGSSLSAGGASFLAGGRWDEEGRAVRWLRLQTDPVWGEKLFKVKPSNTIRKSRVVITCQVSGFSWSWVQILIRYSFAMWSWARH